MESAILAHSHLLVQHLLKQLEVHKREREVRKRRPDWLTAFVHQAAALFEPFAGIGRVGSQCEVVDDGWEARLYLGVTEMVGGKDDGHAQLVSFELDLSRLTRLFSKIDRFEWNVSATDGQNSSFISIQGLVDEHRLSLKAYSRPPREAGPAFRQHVDGSVDAVSR